MIEPRHDHDCDRCVFLGHHGTDDLYVCPDEPTVIARHSSEGGNYSSGLSFVGPRGIAALTEAYDRAVARGLL